MVKVGRSYDLTGDRYGLLTVLSFHSQEKNFRKWNCRCDCGNECIKYGHQIRAGTVVSCGCEAKRRQSLAGKENVLDLVGKRFGRLIVIERFGSDKNQKASWKCVCDCGKEKVLLGRSLMSGNSKSCGCIQKETMHKIRWNPNLTKEDREISKNREMAVPELRFWRLGVYKRDFWTCQVCGVKGKKIVAHHKDGWGWCKEKRLDLGNGVTVCVDDHKEFHSRFGGKNNTELQWTEFVKSKSQMRKGYE